MTLAAPESVAAYLAAEAAKNADAISHCFAQDGAVRDKGREYRGRDAIRQWKAAADAKYQYVPEMINVRTLGDLVTARARLTGEFPGSPIELDHVFNSRATRFLRWRFDHDERLSLPRFGREFKNKPKRCGCRNDGTFPAT
jgi:SnoaL-like domain